MSEYRVAATEISRHHVTSLSEKERDELPAIFLQQLEKINLIDKYMPDYRHQQLKTSNNSGSSSLPQQNEEVLNRKYVFWKDNGRQQQQEKENIATQTNLQRPLESPQSTPAATTQCEFTYLSVVKIDENEKVGKSPDNENTVALSTMHYCLLNESKFEGTYYAFLMTTLVGKKKDTNIGVSRNPIFSVIAHNNQARQNNDPNADVYSFPVIYDKDTACAAPHWRLNTILGPFFTKRAAENCCHAWVDGTRGIVSKENRAFDLALENEYTMYSHKIQIKEPIVRYLYENNAPISYIKASHDIKNQCKSTIVK